MASKRFLMVLDSSAARMPRPGATMAVATLFNSVRFIACSSIFDLDLLLEHDLFRKPVSTFRDHALSRPIMPQVRVAAGVGDALSTSTPGSTLPSSHSRKAPPAVET